MTTKAATINSQKTVKIRDADIPIGQIDDPIRPSRETFDEDKLNELILSIRDAGLIQPISVVVNGERFRVPAGTELAAVIQVHENAIREELNPAEEAEYWWYLLEEFCGGDTNRLAALLHLSLQHVERRLTLKTGDADVFSALGQGLIGAGVAEELNRVKDRPRRVMYLDAAVRGGATRALIREWRSKGEALDAL